jgi:hypothetical protein
MKIILKVIMTEEEWDIYKRSLSVGKMAHKPEIPPSFPVLVATTLVPSPYTCYDRQAEHSFIEQADLRKLLAPSA